MTVSAKTVENYLRRIAELEAERDTLWEQMGRKEKLLADLLREYEATGQEAQVGFPNVVANEVRRELLLPNPEGIG